MFFVSFSVIGKDLFYMSTENQVLCALYSSDAVIKRKLTSSKIDLKALFS